ncbi:hypothetical protein F4801DRAFT_561864 [Xylaria longipes]|nr:hypothetical protein F4801DRAFT_561864 [Xylaria longipes]
MRRSFILHYTLYTGPASLEGSAKYSRDDDKMQAGEPHMAAIFTPTDLQGTPRAVPFTQERLRCVCGVDSMKRQSYSPWILGFFLLQCQFTYMVFKAPFYVCPPYLLIYHHNSCNLLSGMWVCGGSLLVSVCALLKCVA